MHQGAKPRLFQFAQELRKKNTEAEKRLWEEIRLKKLDGFRFRNQHPIGSYIVDFYCHSAKLAIEVDGGYHQKKEQREYDLGRDHDLSLNGVQVLRFTNEEVMQGMSEVLRKIRECLKSRQT